LKKRKEINSKTQHQKRKKKRKNKNKVADMNIKKNQKKK